MSQGFSSSRRKLTAALAFGVLGIGVLLLVLGRASAAPPGQLDTAFGGDGIATIGTGRLSSAALQADGKLVAAGGGAVVRFNPDGSPDTSFGEGDGVVIVPGAQRGVAIQPDGKIVVSGSAGAMQVLRLNPDGALDSSFGGDGIVTALPGQFSQGLAVALQPDGKIVVAGSARLGDGYDRPSLARFTPTGALDPGFGSNGAAVYDFGRLSFANAVGLQADGKIVIAGSQRANLQTTAVLAARLLPNGAQDQSFAANPSAIGYTGVAGLFAYQYSRDAAYSAVFDLAIASNGKIFLGGNATNGLPTSTAPQGADALAVKLNPNGTPDTSFGNALNGAVYLAATTNKDQYTKVEPLPGAQGLALQGNDLILAGYFDELTLMRLAIWALNLDTGVPESGFGTTGRTITGSGELADVVAGPNATLYAVGATGPRTSPTGLAARFGGVSAPPPPPPAPPPRGPRCFGEEATIVGKPGPERIEGTGGADVIVGLGGADRILGGGGRDVICGFGGDDVITSGSGSDRLSGGADDDKLVARFGADQLYGNAGADQLFAGGFADLLRGGPGPDGERGGNGPDNIRGNAGNDELLGNAGEDIIFGNRGDDRLFGGRGEDELHPGPGRDRVTP